MAGHWTVHILKHLRPSVESDNCAQALSQDAMHSPIKIGTSKHL